MSVENIEKIIINVEKELKQLKKELKQLKKKEKKIIKKDNGLERDYELSDKLCDFFDIEKKSKMSRVKVTKKILEYVKSNNLGNKREIILDERLKTLINEEKVTYFTIQKYLTKHIMYDN
jgi:chromatin remodeling complex protein RSC6